MRVYMKNGKAIYDSKQLFEMLLFRDHIRRFWEQMDIRKGKIFLFFLDKLKHDEKRLGETIRKEGLQGPDDNDQLFYFVDIEEYPGLAPLSKDYLSERWSAAADRAKIDAVRDRVMMEVLEGSPSGFSVD